MKKHQADSMMGAGIAIGISIGVAIGTAMDNIGAGIAIGTAIGVSIGAAMSEEQRTKDRDAREREDHPTNET